MTVYTEVLTYLHEEVQVLYQDSELSKIKYMTGKKAGKETTVFTKNLKVKTVKQKPLRYYKIVLCTEETDFVKEIKTESGFLDVLTEMLEKYCKKYKYRIPSNFELQDIVIEDSGIAYKDYLSGSKRHTEVVEETTVPRSLWQIILNNIMKREEEIKRNRKIAGW